MGCLLSLCEQATSTWKYVHLIKRHGLLERGKEMPRGIRLPQQIDMQRYSINSNQTEILKALSNMLMINLETHSTLWLQTKIIANSDFTVQLGITRLLRIISKKTLKNIKAS